MTLAQQIRSALDKVTDQSSFLHGLLIDTLHWPIKDRVKKIEDIGFEWSEDDLRAQGLERSLVEGKVWQIQNLRANQPWGIFLLEFADTAAFRTVLRQVLRGLVPNRRRPSNLPEWQLDNLLFLCMTKDYDRFTFAHFRGEKAANAKLVTFGWEPGDKNLRTLCEFNLPALDWPDDDGLDSAAWLKNWAQAFDKEPLTKDFFKRFDAALAAVQEDLQRYQKLSAAEAYSKAQLLLERLLFLYFLQNRGWLDQQRDYLPSHFASFRAHPKDFSFYEDFLEKLFWSLASPRNLGNRLEGIPFLDGGLFDDDEFNPGPVRKKDNPPLKIANGTFAVVFDELLEAFNFTVREDTPLDQDVAVDPEMLGKVFESIVLHAEAADPDAVSPDKRKETGSYYTPRIVVHFICQETLRLYLERHLPGHGWGQRLKGLFALDPLSDPRQGLLPAGLDRLKELMTPAEGEHLVKVLEKLTCCDPAVGSGAFPVGMLHELVGLRRIAETAAKGYVDPVRTWGHHWLRQVKEDIVQKCLFGVDIQQQAIEICRLRLWLSLVVDFDLGVDPFTATRAQFIDALQTISQLPNLEMNFHRGDSLLDLISDVPVRIEPGAMGPHRKGVEAIQSQSQKLHRASRAEKKRELRVDILRRRLDLTEAVLTAAHESIERKQGSIQPGWLLGQDLSDKEKQVRLAKETQQIRKALDKLTADRKELDKLAGRPFDSAFYPKLRKLEGADFDSPFNFAWRLDFPAIFLRDNPGFDIIVGNPPFVTAQNPKKRELYRERWSLVCKGEYLLLCPFFQLSFELLAHRAEIGFIVSNAFAQRDIGKPIIEKFFPTVGLQKIVDCSGLSFPGHGTPTCIVFGANERINFETPIRVAGIVPGGGDLGTPAEESPLWESLAKHHDEPGYLDTRITVVDRARAELSVWPWNFDASAVPTMKRLEENSEPFSVITHSYGSMFDTHKDEVFFLDPDQARRCGIESEALASVFVGDTIRNYTLTTGKLVLKPYDAKWKLRKEKSWSRLFKYLSLFRHVLGGRASFKGGTYDEQGEVWYRYHQMSPHKIIAPRSLVYPEIATHGHFLVQDTGHLFPQTAPLILLKKDDTTSVSLASSLLNSSAALLWLKQKCFNKGAGREEQRDRFEYAGARIQRLPLPALLIEGFSGKTNQVVDRLRRLSHDCSSLGRKLSTLNLRKVLELKGEAYYDWNCSAPGYLANHIKLDEPFTTTAKLRAGIKRLISVRENLRAKMVGQQEEMDWLIYAAYGLIDDVGPELADVDLTLAKEDRPFCLWAVADGDFDRASMLVPMAWSAAKQSLWRKRLGIIRDHEHVRRIEQPVYKRRWDDQWKIGNIWQCGQPAYDAEFLDAFYWWLSEKAEWWLEHQREPVTLKDWTAALWQDERVQAAWPVAAEAQRRLVIWKQQRSGTTRGEEGEEPALSVSQSTFARYFKVLVREQTVPGEIPFGEPWEELEKKMSIPKIVKNIRGKFNVPRERFWLAAADQYRVAQPF